MIMAPATSVEKQSKIEGLKEQSQFLREPLATELLENTTHFSEEGLQILKFHGSYQQDNRDNRVKGQDKDYQFMLRTRSPGGFIPPELYLTLDRLSEEYGNQTLRATTRQGFQLHGVLKKDLKTVISSMIQSMGSTLGACGDLNRNVMAPPAPYKNRPEYNLAWTYANNIADLLKPQTGAYYEIWLDGEKFLTGEEDPAVKAARQTNTHGTILPNTEEPVYGTYYLPRKFKCAVTVPGDNSIDLFTQDVGLVLLTNGAGEAEGFNIYVGGGMGRTHNKVETFARLSDPLGYVEAADIYNLVKAIVATQRDYGERYNRRQARMKYLVEDWGLDKFRQTVETYLGKALGPLQALPEFNYFDYLGWQEQGDGKVFLGLPIQNGRIVDREGFQLKTALRQIVDQFHIPLRVTGNQDLLLCDIEPAQQPEIQAILDRCGIPKETELAPLVRYSMACPALPTCGLAITEAERIFPSVLQRIHKLLEKVGLPKQEMFIRMTGCPNGCARPYMAELAFVGSAPDAYQVWLGGSSNQTRLAQPYLERLTEAELEAGLEPVFLYFKLERKRNEGFGDFCDRVGFAEIRNFVARYQENPEAFTKKSRERRVRYRVELTPELHNLLKDEATRQGKAIRDLAADAIQIYLQESAAAQESATAQEPTTAQESPEQPSAGSSAEPQATAQLSGQSPLGQSPVGQPPVGQPSGGQPSGGQPSGAQLSPGQPSAGQPSAVQPASHGAASPGSVSPIPPQEAAASPSPGFSSPSSAAQTAPLPDSSLQSPPSPAPSVSQSPDLETVSDGGERGERGETIADTPEDLGPNPIDPETASGAIEAGQP